MSKQQREEATVLLSRFFGMLPESMALAQWRELTPQQRGDIALHAERGARLFGLSFRELMSFHPQPAPQLTAQGYKRLKASPEVKERRREEAHRRGLQKEWERKQ